MYNRVILMGRLTRDPELRTTPSGISMCRFSIAVDRNFVKQGEERQADFFDVTVWRNTAEFVCKYFSKGKMIHIEGRIQNNNYEDQNGVKHYAQAIIADQVCFCGDKSGSGSGTQTGGTDQPQTQQNAPKKTEQQQASGYNALHRQPSQKPQQQPQPIELGDLGDFEEILSDGEVPF